MTDPAGAALARHFAGVSDIAWSFQEALETDPARDRKGAETATGIQPQT
jgi:hypothetical protein